MLIIALETATRSVGCALWSEEGPVACFELVAGQRHAEVLMPAINDLCWRAGVHAGDLEAIVADVGPGLFTGLRVGLATAKAIANARGLPSAGVTSLEALAHPHRRRPGLLASIVDARRGEVFWALYWSDGSHHREISPPAASPPEEAAQGLRRQSLWGGEKGAGGPVLAVGDGAWRYRDLFGSYGLEVGGPAALWPSPLAVAEIGAARLAKDEDGGQGGPLEALYLRPPDVRIGWDEIGGRVAPPETLTGAATPAGGG
ncbi:MAG TPA: tRNA (adenosine(37)-N6)-threonylcarbamoyltransferase complex dimerization subunit type 1 TsaB [Acidimicrobiales bacterium]|nr:tRNA (adenosine(37)-N6)-threonylcarbamoyltransferase complex dimerization subunit type 1 TsaB [Acidimicrobiales bacterium]